MDIGQSFQNVLDRIVGFLPNLIGFLLLLVIGYIVARLVAAGVRKLLEKVGLDRRLDESGSREYLRSVLAGASPAHAVAKVVFWVVFAFFVFAAIAALQIPALTMFMNRVIAYLPNVLVAILIFIVAALVAGAVGVGVRRTMGDTPTGKVAGTVLPALVMVIAVFMILQQLRIAEQIVQIAFAATMGALALGLALAFGLGGRPVAQRMLEDAYRRSREKEDQARGRQPRRATDEEVSGDSGQRETGTAFPPSVPEARGTGTRDDTEESPRRS